MTPYDEFWTRIKDTFRKSVQIDELWVELTASVDGGQLETSYKGMNFTSELSW